jgi:hypothetical protein
VWGTLRDCVLGRAIETLAPDWAAQEAEWMNTRDSCWGQGVMFIAQRKQPITIWELITWWSYLGNLSVLYKWLRFSDDNFKKQVYISPCVCMCVCVRVLFSTMCSLSPNLQVSKQPKN